MLKLNDQQFDALCLAADNAGRKLTSLDFAEHLFPEECDLATNHGFAGLRKRATKVAMQLVGLGFLSLERGYYQLAPSGREYLETPVPAGEDV